MADESDHLIDKLELVGRAKEDQYFRKIDQELIAKRHREAENKQREAQRLAGVFAKLLVAVDFSPFSRIALSYASDVAKRLESAVIVVHVIPGEAVEVRIAERHPERPLLVGASHAMHDEGLAELVHEQREKAYEALQQFLPGDLAGQTVELRVLVGSPFERILETARDDNVDLIVLGTHGRSGLSRLITGSVAERVVRFAPCPVLTVKEKTSTVMEPPVAP
jgi:nucleotide-binding universal stress UspA family protein